MARQSTFFALTGSCLLALYLVFVGGPNSFEEVSSSAGQLPSQGTHLEASEFHTADRAESSAKSTDSSLLDPLNWSRPQGLKRDGSVPLDPEAAAKRRREREKDPAYIQELIDKALYALDPDDRSSAVDDLAYLEASPEIVRACLEALGDGNEDVRLEAALALEFFEDPAAIPRLERVVKEDSSPDVREAAAESLAVLTRLAQAKPAETSDPQEGLPRMRK